MFTFNLNNEPTHIQQTICDVLKISNYPIEQVL